MLTVEIAIEFKVNGEARVLSRYAELPGVPRIGERVGMFDLPITESFAIRRADVLVDEVTWFSEPPREAPWLDVTADAFVGGTLLDYEDKNEGWFIDQAGSVVILPIQSEESEA